MKRVYSNRNKKKKAELRRLVLRQLAKMRKKIRKEHPGMLEKMQDMMVTQKKSVAVAPQQQTSQETRIDQKKNIEAVEKMLSLKNSDPAFEKAVRAMLSKQEN